MVHEPAASVSLESSVEMQIPRPTDSESAFLARFQVIHMHSDFAKHALCSYL